MKKLNPVPNDETSNAIKVYCRVRPPSKQLVKTPTCVQVMSNNSLFLNSKPNSKQFTFDCVAGENTTQEEVFQSVGKPIAESCIQGYNGTIFAYGQTGSGKTYTMLGPSEQQFDKNQGLIPRTINHLFQLAFNKKQLEGEDFQFLCKCSFIEIYNEQVYDLLDTNKTASLNIRECIQRGVFVDHLIEQVASNPSSAIKILSKGWHNRTVAGTAMNRESSRSHAVFVMTIETKQKDGKTLKSLLNMVDLAGSERQKDAMTTGTRLREAGSINKSLSVFGNVINSLVNSNKGKSRHIPYRDSKLTFLLRDSLGGNSKTFIIANIHPGLSCFGETLSTLQFAQRAKLIVNQATVNESTNLADIQRENKLLKKQIQQLMQNGPSTAIVPALGQGDTNQEMLSSISENNFEEMFYHCMLIYRMELAELSKKDARIRQLKEQSEKKEKLIATNRMIIKFRDARIKDLEKKHKLNESDAVNKYKQEIALLKKQISDHPEVSGHLHTIDNLKNALEYVNKNKNIEIFNQFTACKKQELISEYKKLKTSKQIDTEESLNSNKDRIIELENENRELTNKLSEQENMYDSKIKDYQSKLVELESQLAGKKAECNELNNMLETARQSSKIQVENLVSIHNSTIKSITTPQRPTNKRHSNMKLVSTPAKQMRLLDDTNSPALKDMSDISLDSSPGGLLKSTSSTPQLFKTGSNTPKLASDPFKSPPEFKSPSNDFKLPSLHDKVVQKQAQEVESAQISALQSEVDTLKQQKETIEEQLHTKEQDYNDLLQSNASLQQNADSNKKLLEESNTGNEELKKQIGMKQKKLDEVNSELEIRLMEVRDYKIMLNSADKELKEKKIELKESVEQLKKMKSANNELMKLKPQYELKCDEVSMLEASKMQLQSDIERSEAEINMCKHELQTSKDEVTSLKNKCDILHNENETLRDELMQLHEASEGSNESLKKSMEELRDIKNELHTKCDQFDKLNGEHDALKADSEQQKTAILNKDTMISNLTSKAEELELKCDKLNYDVTTANKENEENVQKIQQYEDENKKLQLDNEKTASDLKTLKLSSKIEIDNLNFKNENLQTDLTTFDEEYQKLSVKCKQYETDMSSLQKQVEVIGEKLNKEQEKHLNEVSELKLQLSNEKSQTMESIDKLGDYTNELQQKSHSIEVLQKQLETAINDYQLARNRNNDIQEKLDERSLEINQLKTKHEEAFQLIQSQHTQSQSSMEKDFNEKISSLQNKLAMLEQQQDLGSNRSEMLEQQLKSRQEQCDKNEQEIIRLQEVNQNHVESIYKLQNKNANDLEEKSRVEKTISEYKDENEKLQTRISELLSHSNHLQKIKYMKRIKDELVGVTEERNSLQLKVARLSKKNEKLEALSRKSKENL